MKAWSFGPRLGFFGAASGALPDVEGFAEGVPGPEPGAAGYESEMPILLGIYGSPEYHMADVDGAGTRARWERTPATKRKSILHNERFLEGRHDPPRRLRRLLVEPLAEGAGRGR